MFLQLSLLIFVVDRVTETKKMPSVRSFMVLPALPDTLSDLEFIAKNIDILVKILESQILKEPSHWLLI